MASIRRLAVAFGVVSLVSLMGARVEAQDGQELDRTPDKCIKANSISRRMAIDNRTVLFSMKGDKFFRSDLPTACPVLVPGETRLRYVFKAQGQQKLQQLCDVDSFTVERKEGTACRLGQFHPITAEEAAVLNAKVAPPAAAPAATQ